jgi:hypothetical protein
VETAEDAVAEQNATAKEKRSLEEGEVAPATQPSPKKKKPKQSFFCKLHGADQPCDADNCKVLLGEISKLKVEIGRHSSSFGKNNNQQTSKSTWTDRKPQVTSCSAEQLKKIVHVTKKKVMKQAKEIFESQLQSDLESIKMDDDQARD